MATNEYQEYFQPELDLLDDQYNKNEQLYDEVHGSLERNLERMDGKTMFGTTSPHRDIAELGKVLNDIRGNQVSTIKERSSIKKTIKELELKRDNMKQNSDNAQANEIMMKQMLSTIMTKNPEVTKATVSEKVNNKGKEELANIDPNTLGLNNNDLAMIDRFKKNLGKR